jgi:predicted DNA-binding protein
MQTPEMVREKQLNIRLSKEESDRLDALCAHYDVTAAALFRRLLKQEEHRMRDDLARRKATTERTIAERAFGQYVAKGGDPDLVDHDRSTTTESSFELRDAAGRRLAHFDYDGRSPDAPMVLTTEIPPRARRARK